MFSLPYLLQTLIWIPTQIVLRVFGRFSVRGTSHLAQIDRSHGVILMANHTSILDPILVAAALPLGSGLRPLYFVSLSKEHYAHRKIRVIAGGNFFRMWGAYPAYRGLPTYEEIFCEHTPLLAQQKTIVIFPEGRVSQTGELGDPKPGIAHLARLSGATIVPVHINGAWKISWKDFIFRRRVLSVTFGASIFPSSFDHYELFSSLRNFTATRQ